MKINQNVKKVCSFYASECHLTTMLLPHINEKINEKVKITAVLEKGITKEMEMLLSKLHLKNTEKIQEINWKETNINEINIEKIKDSDEIIIAGSIDYIKQVNAIIEKQANSNIKQTIIDCYNFEETRDSVKEILDNHNTVLNTAGEKDKEKYLTELKIS